MILFTSPVLIFDHSKMCFLSVIPFKNEMAIELLEKGRVRFWTQVEKCTSACQVDYVFNDVIITEEEVGVMAASMSSRGSTSWKIVNHKLIRLHFSMCLCSQKYTVNFDKSTGIIEMFMDSLEVSDEGTFTFDLVDGKAKGATSLVLIGDGESSNAVFDFHVDD